MAVARIVKTQITPDEYEQMRERLGVGDAAPPPGGHFHVAAIGEDGKIRIVEVWDSREEAEAWAEKVATASQALGAAMYAQGDAAEGAGASAGSPSDTSDEDIVEAEIVDEPADGNAGKDDQ